MSNPKQIRPEWVPEAYKETSKRIGKPDKQAAGNNDTVSASNPFARKPKPGERKRNP